MNKPKYFKFSFPSGDPTGIASPKNKVETEMLKQ